MSWQINVFRVEMRKTRVVPADTCERLCVRHQLRIEGDDGFGAWHSCANGIAGALLACRLTYAIFKRTTVGLCSLLGVSRGLLHRNHGVMASPKMRGDAGPNVHLAHIVEWVHAQMTRACEPAPGAAADVAQYAQLIYVYAGLQCVRLAAAIRECVPSPLCGAAAGDEKQSVLTQGLTRELKQEIYGTGLPVRKLLRMVQKRFVRAPRVDPVTAVSWGLATVAHWLLLFNQIALLVVL
jgi:hypothetical protein